MIRTGRRLAAPDGVSLHLAEVGAADAPPVLLLHGFPQWWGAWEGLMTALAPDFRLLAPDQRGYGLSDKPEDVRAYAPRRLVADVLGCIDDLAPDGGRLDLVAHDWGGAIAWSVALRHPDRIRRLVILNAPHPWLFWKALRDDPGQQAASAYMNWLRRPGSEDALAADGFAKLESFFLGMEGAAWFTPAERARHHAAWSVPGALRGGCNWYRASPLHPPMEGDPGPAGFELDPADYVLRVPVRMLWGLKDHALPPSLLDGIERFAPDLELVTLPDCGHWLLHEAPSVVHARVRAFLAA